jgi:hypothetical protein
MSFQWIFDNAETISINKRAVVAQSITRGNRVKSSILGGQTWRFDVKLPDGLRWSDWRSYIEAHEALDLVTTERVLLNNPGYSYINQYQGNSGNIVVKYLSDTEPTNLTITSGDTITSGEFYFRTGDWLQLGTTGNAYSVIRDVPHDSNVVTVNRPVIEAASNSTSYTTRVGQEVSFNVVCISMPSWTLFGYDQVQWDGSFVFYEVV